MTNQADSVRQMRAERTESIAEINEDVAGCAVGNAMVATTRAGKSGDSARLARTTMDILCL